MRAAMLLALMALGAVGLALAQAGPVDCAAPTGGAQRLVCGNPELGRLDRELSRLYRLADAAGGATLQDARDAWAAERDACDDVACLRRSYAAAIAGLRAAYPSARSEDGTGISLGPFATRCEGYGPTVEATFVNADPGIVYLRWPERGVVLDQMVSASGARYEATLPDGHYLFWNKGNGAMLEGPGIAGTLDCGLADTD